MSFLNIFRKKQTQTNSSESSYASNFSDQVSGDYVKKKSRDAVVEDAESLWDCRDRMLLSLRKIKAKVGEDEVEIQPEDAPLIFEEFQPDTTTVDLQEDSVSNETIDQSTGTAEITYNPMADNSQQMRSQTSKVPPDTTIVDLQGRVSSQTIDQSTDTATEDNQQISTDSMKKCISKKTKLPIYTDTVVTCKPTAGKNQQINTECRIKRIPKKTNLLPMIEPQNTEWGEDCMSMKENSAYNSMVDKLCELQTSSKYPKRVKNRLLAPVMVPVHKIAYGVSVLAKHVIEKRQLLERCLQQTDHQAAAQRPEIQFRMSGAVAEAKYLTGKLTFLVSDVNHTTGTPDQIKMLIEVYDACFRRFKKIMKIVRWIEMAQSEGMNDNNNDR